MISGILKMWKEDEGWGFIEAEDGEDYFFNISSVRSGQRVREDSKVKFDTEETHKGPQAINVSLT